MSALYSGYLGIIATIVKPEVSTGSVSLVNDNRITNRSTKACWLSQL